MTSKFVAATMLVVVAGIAAAMTGSSFIEQSRVQSMHSDMHITSIQLHDMHDICVIYIKLHPQPLRQISHYLHVFSYGVHSSLHRKLRAVS